MVQETIICVVSFLFFNRTWGDESLSLWKAQQQLVWQTPNVTHLTVLIKYRSKRKGYFLSSYRFLTTEYTVRKRLFWDGYPKSE